MAYSFANFCPHCRVASEIFVNESTLPEGSVQVHYQCPSCKGPVTCSCSYFVSVVAVPGNGPVAKLAKRSLNQPVEAESVTEAGKFERVLVSKTDGKTNGRPRSLGSRPVLPAKPLIESVEEIGTLAGHRGPVNAVTFSADQNLVVSGGNEGGIRLRRLGAGASADVVVPKVHAGGVRLLALSPDNKMLASVASSQESTVYLWDLADAGPKLRALLRPSPCPLPTGGGRYGWGVESLAFSPRVNLLAIGYGSNILFWDLNRLGPQEDCILEGHTQAVSSLSFAPNGLLMASGSQDGTVCLWTTELSNPQRLAVLESSKQGVLSVAFAANGRVLASGDNDQIVHLWEYNGEQFRHEKLEGHEGPVRLVLFPTDGRTLLSVDISHRAYLWDLASQTKIREWLLPGGRTIASVAGTCDGRYLAAGKVGFITVLRLLAKSKEQVAMAV
jgi:WD40 repeat protein